MVVAKIFYYSLCFVQFIFADTTISEHPSNIYVSLTNDFDSFASFDKVSNNKPC